MCLVLADIMYSCMCMCWMLLFLCFFFVYLRGLLGFNRNFNDFLVLREIDMSVHSFL